MIAEMLDVPFISYASKLEKEGDDFLIERDIEGGKEVIKTSLPVVVSSAKGLAEQRIPNMRGIMQARMKPLKVVEPVDCDDLTTVVSYEIPIEKTTCKMVDPENVGELVQLLKNEAKVI
jgi:electron transfer flavoprotein beta subunit